MQWVHYTKTCSSSAHGAYLSAETYKPIDGYLTWDILEADCDNWAEYVNEDHLVGHGGHAEYIVVDAPPKEWIEKQIIRYEAKIKSNTDFLKFLKKLK
jgi:hypothetical protein